MFKSNVAQKKEAGKPSLKPIKHKTRYPKRNAKSSEARSAKQSTEVDYKSLQQSLCDSIKTNRRESAEVAMTKFKKQL